MKQRQVLSIALVLKALLLGLVFFIGHRYPQNFNYKNYFGNLYWSQPSFATFFQTWDGMHYLFIAQNGYHAGHPTTAFFPLWPFLIRIASPLFAGHFLLTSLALSNLLSTASLLILHGWIKKKDEMLADLSTLFILAFPGSFFFILPYSESLFFFLSVLFFLLLSKKMFFFASIICFLATITRPVGIFSVIPLAYTVFKDKENRRQWPFILAGPLGLLTYFLIFKLSTGDPFAGLKIQQNYRSFNSLSKLFDIIHLFQNYFTVHAFHDVLYSFLDRFWFTLFVITLPFIWNADKGLFYWALCLGLFPVLINGFTSYLRYLNVIFPFFMALGDAFAKMTPTGRKYSSAITLLILFGFQIYFLIQHINNYWVG